MAAGKRVTERARRRWREEGTTRRLAAAEVAPEERRR